MAASRLCSDKLWLSTETDGKCISPQNSFLPLFVTSMMSQTPDLQMLWQSCF